MNICIVDTEVISIDKPFCYNIGYGIYNDEGKQLLRKDFVVEQIWHNQPLFSTAYYADKRPIYVDRMRKRLTVMDKFGYITQEMYRDFKRFEVKHAYAYNSDFDEKVFNFNCEYFHCINPFDDIEIYDIWGYASQFIAVKEEYKKWAEINKAFTASGNYSANAENVFRYISMNNDFSEEHTAAADSDIEAEILFYCIKNLGAELNKHYDVKKVIARPIKKPFKVMVNGEVKVDVEYLKMWKKEDLSLIKLTT